MVSLLAHRMGCHATEAASKARGVLPSRNRSRAVRGPSQDAAALEGQM